MTLLLTAQGKIMPNDIAKKDIFNIRTRFTATQINELIWYATKQPDEAAAISTIIIEDITLESASKKYNMSDQKISLLINSVVEFIAFIDHVNLETKSV